jgi:2-polyprenyl-6-methoxyphenol hydroxylase-like FAD-dependent oxidoreductase
VLIAGGGPVGLVASICLSRLGVESLLVERHPTTTLHPKARNLNLRTMEILRPWGIDAELLVNALPRSWSGCIIYTATLAGRELGRMPTASFESDRASAFTPVTGVLSSQDVYEPVFHRLAERLGPGELRFHCELIDSALDGDRVRSRVRRLDDGAEVEVASRYLLACDGWSSSVRHRLGIAMEGPAAIGHFVNVYFRADLSAWVAHRPAVLYFIASDETRGVFQPLDGGERWLCQISYDGTASTFASYTAERCLDWIRRAVGATGVAAEILSVGTWTMNATVAGAFRSGPFLLAGDAAHQLPPTGGFGMNTGVQDVHNLAWKLQGVLQGWAGPALLDSYELERRPVARMNADRSLENSRMVGRINRAAVGAENSASPEEAVAASRRYGNFMGMDLGFCYERGALVPDGTRPPDSGDAVIDYVPTARPGHRAPHLPLERDGREISTLDLFDRSFTLLVGPQAGPWREAGRAAAARLGAPLQGFTVGPGGDLRDPNGRWLDLYGVGPRGAVLVRPDGHVGWRCADQRGDAGAELDRALARILCR